MANYDALKAAMAAVIKPNGQGRITGAKHQAVLRDVIDTLGALYQFGGVAHPSDTYDKADIRAAYLASEAGTYEAFGGLELDGSAVMVLRYDGEWHAEAIGITAGPALVTWAELKALRDAGALDAGAAYRITDYTTTTAQADTQAAGHLFDIVVVALDNATLSEDALAVAHEGEDYFAGCKLEAWNLKYCLDNDTNRFGWADADNGKGVIWWMRDEWDNECPYDFKNIQFKCADNEYRYTFAIDKYEEGVMSAVLDATIAGNDGTITNRDGIVMGVTGNIIRQYIRRDEGGAVAVLNAIRISRVGGDDENYQGCNANEFGRDCYGIDCTGAEINGSTFGAGCYGISIGLACIQCSFGARCNGISINVANDTEFGSNVSNLTFAGSLDACKIGSGASNITIVGASDTSLYNCIISNGLYSYDPQTTLAVEFAPDEDYTQIACFDSEFNLQIKVLGDL